MIAAFLIATVAAYHAIWAQRGAGAVAFDNIRYYFAARTFYALTPLPPLPRLPHALSRKASSTRLASVMMMISDIKPAASPAAKEALFSPGDKSKPDEIMHA